MGSKEAITGHVRAMLDCGREPTGAARARRDRHFACLLALMEARCGWLVRRYGLDDLRDDAMQACAIGLFRAVGRWDEARGGFETHAIWQMRAELQALRHRMRLDQRPAARRMAAQTVSADAMCAETGEAMLDRIEAPGSLERAESGASEHMARRTADRMLGRYFTESRSLALDRMTRGNGDTPSAIGERLARERAIMDNLFFASPSPLLDDGVLNAEQQRQVARRVCRNLARQARMMQG